MEIILMNTENSKIIAPTWNDEFELPDGSYSVSYFQDYIWFIIKKHETSTKISPVHVCINRIIIDYCLKLKVDIS